MNVAEITLADAAAEVVTRLTRELEALGHSVAGLFDYGDSRCEVRLLIDFDGGPDGLDLRVTADADRSGRLARVKVAWDRELGRSSRYGGPDCVGTFADFRQLAGEISREVARR